MTTQLTSNTASDIGFRLIPLNDPVGAGAEVEALAPEITVFDLSSDGPLPELPSEPGFLRVPTTSDATLLSPPPASGHDVLRGAGGLWMEGEVLMCACPDCGAPMSIRLWLMIADCWKCGTGIELTEEQEREAKRLLQERERNKRQAQTAESPSAPRPAAKRTATSIPAATQPAEKDGVATSPATPPSRPVARANRTPSSTSPRTMPRPNQRRRSAARTLARRRARRSRRPTVWLRSLFRTTPAWLVSLIFHLVLLTLLALLTIPNDDEGNTITLNSTVSKDVRRAGQEDIPNPADEVIFDLPVPESIDLENQQAREAVLRADQDARELRLVDSANPQLPDINKIKQQIGDPQSRSASLMARDPRVRVEVLEQEGGTTLTEAAVARGLRWLASEQQPDGRWKLDGGTRSDAAGTSLALFPFLGAGQTHLTGRYKDRVSHGLRWLVGHQGEDGDLRAGTSGNSGMYAHGQAAIVLCEAFLMTGDEELRVPAQKAIDFIVAAQNPDGGWRYKPTQECSPAERRSDTSVVGWQLMALQSARAANLTVPESTFELASHYLDSVQHRDGSQYAYQATGRATHVMTAEALLCRIYLGWNKDYSALMDGVEYLEENHLPNAGEPNMYYWYYATQTFHHVGGANWNRWNLRMRDVLVNTQETRGRDAGSWTPRGGHASSGGRVYMTSLAVCSLEVYYRHLPIFRQIDVE